MPFEHEEVIKAQYQQLAAERAQAVADYEANRISDDGDGTMYAANRILEIDQKAAALDRITHNYVTSRQAAPQGSRWGLSADESDVAKSSYGHLPTQDAREQAYAEQKARYQHLRATGQYRDDQGTVRRG